MPDPFPEFVEIPSGTFMMGSEQGPDDEKPVHQVKIASPFYISATVITFDQYAAFAGATKRDVPNDQGWGRGNRPVINVSWQDARAYADWLGEQMNNDCRLPSEAEWEYAARADTTSEYALPAPGGGDDVKDIANCADCGGEWAGNSTAPVASFPANAWGLYDMHGNVEEWVEDYYHDSYWGASNDGSASVDGGDYRVLRGGSWVAQQSFARSASRFCANPDRRDYGIGFRVLCSSPIP